MKPILKVKEISLSGVVNIIRSLRDSRTKHANGLDTTFSLNVQKDGLVCPTAHLINVSFKRIIFPSTWKSSVETNMFKVGDLEAIDPSVFYLDFKVAEQWASKQPSAHLIKGHTPLQFGFRTINNNSQLLFKKKNVIKT